MIESGLDLVGFLLIVAAIAAVVVASLWYRTNAKRIEAEAKRIAENFLASQSEEIRQLLNEAVRVGADFAESIDLDGQLTELFDGFRTNSEAKLYAAIDAASTYLEFQLEARGYDVDIPEELLKVAIQTFVFNSRDRYPTGGLVIVDDTVVRVPTVNEVYATKAEALPSIPAPLTLTLTQDESVIGKSLFDKPMDPEYDLENPDNFFDREVQALGDDNQTVG